MIDTEIDDMLTSFAWSLLRNLSHPDHDTADQIKQVEQTAALAREALAAGSGAPQRNDRTSPGVRSYWAHGGPAPGPGQDFAAKRGAPVASGR